jgi:aspartate racemase
VVAPAPPDQEIVHDIYANELVNGVFRPESRARILSVVGRLRAEQRIDGMILGGTELPLLLREREHDGLPFLDTTRIHVEEIVARLLS